MASLLETQVAKLVYQGFKGKLLTGTLRKETVTAVNSKGDTSTKAVKTYSFEGIVDTFSALFIQAAGIPATDVRVLIIANSLSVTPAQDDKVKVRSEWYQLRRLVERDPANATYIFAGFKIEAPV